MEVVQLLERALVSAGSRPVTKQFALTGLMKLSARVAASPDAVARIRGLASRYAASCELELQQRSAEYCVIFRHHEGLRPALLERMPVMEGRAESGRDLPDEPAQTQKEPDFPQQPLQQQPDLIDIDVLGGILNDGGGGSSGQPQAGPQPAPPGGGMAGPSLFESLINLGGEPEPSQPTPASLSNGGGGGQLGPLTEEQQGLLPSVTAYEQNGVLISVQVGVPNSASFVGLLLYVNCI